MADESDNLAFRRLITCVADTLTDEEVRKIIYIYLYAQREQLFPNLNKLEVFVALEYAEVFSPSHPEGLLNILDKDLKNRQLAHLVKDFIKERKHRSVKGCNNSTRQGSKASLEVDNETHLLMCYKMALAQANVLMMHLERLRQAVTGGEVKREEAKKAVENISETAVALTKLKEKASEGVDVSPSCDRSVVSTSGVGEEEEEDYEDIVSCPIFEEVTVPTPRAQVHTKSKTTPSPTMQKPPLKPKPKLNAYQQQKHKLVGGSSGSSNAPESSSLPLLSSSPKTTAYESADEGEDYYIDPVCFQRDDAISETLQQRKSPLPIQTDSVHFKSGSANKPSDHIQLPDPPTHSQQEWGVVRGRDYTQDCDEDYEPVYDEISEHTLLLRMPRPRPESSSSSD